MGEGPGVRGRGRGAGGEGLLATPFPPGVSSFGEDAAMDDINVWEPPTAEALADLFARSRPALEDLFRRRWISAEEAEAILDEVVTELLLHWHRIDDAAPRLPPIADRIIRVRLESPLLPEDFLE